MASIPPNQTIYVQNLYEKLPKQGGWSASVYQQKQQCCVLLHTTRHPVPSIPCPHRGCLIMNRPYGLANLRSFVLMLLVLLCLLPCLTYRAAEGVVRHVFTVWQNPRRGCAQDATHARPGLGGVLRRCSCNKRKEHHARLPVL